MSKKQIKTTPAPKEDQTLTTPQGQMEQPLPMDLDIRIRPMNKGNLMAYASMNINKSFGVEGIRVVSGEKGLFVAMPSQKGSDGVYREVCFPITKEARGQIQNAVLDAYQQTLEQMQAQAAKQQMPAEQESVPEQAMGM